MFYKISSIEMLVWTNILADLDVAFDDTHATNIYFLRVSHERLLKKGTAVQNISMFLLMGFQINFSLENPQLKSDIEEMFENSC